MHRCPYCGSKKLYKSGLNAKGQQRYFCKNCCRKSADGVDYVKDKTCPSCGSHNIKRAGFDRYDHFRYACKDCNKYFSDKTKPPNKIANCPHCNSDTVVKAGKTAIGTQRYKCTTCNKFFSEERQKKPRPTYAAHCPRCHHNECYKSGKYKDRQVYKCPICGHRFVGKSTYHIVTEQLTLQIQGMYRVGMKKRAIARMTSVSLTNVRKLTQGMKIPNLKERIIIALKNGSLIKRIANELHTTTAYVRTIMKNELEPMTLTESQKRTIIEFSRIFKLSRIQIRNLVPLNVVDREKLLISMEN